MNLLIFLLIGVVAEWLAGRIMKGRGFGLAGDLVVGVLGALLGGVLFKALGVEVHGWFNSTVMAVIGAMVLLFLLGLLRRA